MSKIAILFVDDHQEILNGLKRMCRSMRSEWNPDFALGGQAAIDLMGERQFDVLVTDMRMPGVEGVQVLQSALQLQPHMVRVVLSGQYDIDHFIRSGWPAHRFLSKPCEADVLKESIRQVFAMRELLEDQQLKDLVTRADRLPILPGLYFEIEKELNSENASMQKVGEIISSDVGITAKVLQLVNSPIFGSQRKISSPAQAVVMLGADVIKSLALYIQSCSNIRVPEGVSLERISTHSMLVGRLAREIARMEGAPEHVCSEAFLAGILQNIGSLLIINAYPDDYHQIISRANSEGRPVWEVEYEVLGAGHAKLGAYLISLWGLSSEIVEAVAYHIQPSRCPNGDHSLSLMAVHVANALEKEPGINGALINNDFDFEYLEKRGVLAKLPGWQKLHQQISCGDGV